MNKQRMYWLAAIVVGLIALVYWPVVNANFVWDDWESFRDAPWLTQGEQWKHYIFRGFNHWVFYFRPLGVAFFTWQVRLFDSAPGPMHAVSLALHLIDTVLVGMLAQRCGTLAGNKSETRMWATVGCMALYGLHPALIESVSWIGCQFDLIATMLMLLALLADASIESPARRALTIALLFFLAACTKESAVSLPLLIALFDWQLFSGKDLASFATRLRTILARNYMTYASILVAGIAYLILRRWALGVNNTPVNGIAHMSPLGQWQTACYTYGHYLKIMLWPIDGMNALHPVDLESFNHLSTVTLVYMTVTLPLFGWSLYATIARRSVVAFLILAATFALLPVLHILPYHFERSLYHERYATTALAIVCATLPLLRLPATGSNAMLARIVKPLVMALAFLWFAFAIVDIRLITPMWKDDVHLWRWTYDAFPQSAQARDNLLKSYEHVKDYEKFNEIGDAVMADNVPCTSCALLIAKVAIERNDMVRATKAIEIARHSSLLASDRETLGMYYLLAGQMLIKQGRLEEAEQLIQASMAADPKHANDPETTQSLDQLRTLKSNALKP